MKGMSDAEAQSIVHDALVEALREIGYLDDDQILTGWHVCFEKANAGQRPSAGSFYGPESMTTWRAMGLVQWADRFCFTTGGDEGDEDDDEG
jgi:hypothetical protein